MNEPPLLTDLIAKLKAESVARQKAVERSEALMFILTPLVLLFLLGF